ncbi:MAG TPA: lipocalin family protein [Xanthomarina sp.]|nr:lipocalin family protein [Xanthomarina sp.]
MKKLILLFSVLALTFTSCSSDDDAAASQDQFIGNWKYYKFYEDDVEVQLGPCDYETRITISANGTFTTKVYDGNSADACELVETTSGTWENLGNGMYSTTSEGDTFVQEIKFEDNRMYLDEVFDGVVYRDVFIRQ